MSRNHVGAGTRIHGARLATTQNIRQRAISIEGLFDSIRHRLFHLSSPSAKPLPALSIGDRSTGEGGWVQPCVWSQALTGKERSRMQQGSRTYTLMEAPSRSNLVRHDVIDFSPANSTGEYPWHLALRQ